MGIPSSITAGVDVVWIDAATTDIFGNDVTNVTHNLTYYFRLNTAGEGASATGVAYENGWKVTLPAATSAAMDASPNWYFQALLTAISGGAVTEYSRGQIEVQASLVYAGSPGAFDGRTQSQKDLDAVQAAIRSLMTGGATQEYRIGNRSLKRYDLTELLALESRLKAVVARENKAKLIASGLGDPNNLYVRFNQG
ncbi:MAG: hypothetical protein EB075_13155 [Bacteroidetes bacterium]|nr:hypothetical protein [Bacteroidota bacterium]